MAMIYPPSEDTFLALRACRLAIKVFKPESMLDMGCGTGFIGINLAKEFGIKVAFADIDENAIEFARSEAKKANISAKFYLSDLFSNIKEHYDLVCFNAPYLPGIPKTIEDYQLLGGPTGGETIIRFLDQCIKNHIKYAVVVYSSLSNLDLSNYPVVFMLSDKLFFERIFAAAINFTLV